MPATEQPLFHFGVFELDLAKGELRKSGVQVHLQPQPLKVLTLLVSRGGQLVTREELQSEIWGNDTFVDFEQGLNFCIKKIRTTLGDDADTPRYIETLPRRGYRFVAPVVVGRDGSAPHVLLPSAPTALAPPRHRLLLWTAVGLTALVAGFFAWQQWTSSARPGAPAPAGRVMLVVLPFENLSGDPEQEYFSDGLTEEMTTELGRLQPERLGVIARTSAMEYKKKGGGVRRIAGELGVDYVLEGSVRREGERVRITAQLIAARDQTHLWAESYDRDRSGVLSLQREVALAIARQIELKLTPQQQARLAGGRSINPEAHEAYLKGRYSYNRHPDGTQKAAEYFQEAINKDPGYAPAYVGLADTYGLLTFGPLPPREWMSKARVAAAKAVELDPALAEAHSSLAGIKDYEGDWDGALREHQRALALSPNSAAAHAAYAQHLAFRGRFQEAEAEIKRAEELDPLNLFIKTQVGWIYSWAGQLDRAMAQWQKVIELDPNFSLAHFNLGGGYALKGKYPEAIAAYNKALTFQDSTPYWAMLAHAHAMAGERGEARRVLAKINQRAKREHVSPFLKAGVHLALGEKGQALDLLEQGHRDHDPFMTNLKFEPFWWGALRDEPRFQALLRRMNFPPDWEWPEGHRLIADEIK